MLALFKCATNYKCSGGKQERGLFRLKILDSANKVETQGKLLELGSGKERKYLISPSLTYPAPLLLPGL